MQLKTTIKSSPQGLLHHENTSSSAGGVYVHLAGTETGHVDRTVEVTFDQGNVEITVDGRKVFPAR